MVGDGRRAETMEESFRVRVDKAFGALGSSPSPSAGVTSALWCLTDEEIVRKEWNRSRDGGGGYSGSDSGQSVRGSKAELNLRELSDSEEEGGGIDGEKKKRRRDKDCSAEISAEEFLEVQSNIGRDCTLDYEEEEDEYDKVAVGTEWMGDHTYMRHVKYTDSGIDELNAYRELPNSFHDVVRDPRANHTAAQLRLKEDAEAAANFNALQLSDNSAIENAEIDDHLGEVDGDDVPKWILKSENLLPSGSQKYTQFSAAPRSGVQLSSASGLACEPDSKDDFTLPEQASDPNSAGHPNYVRNPLTLSADTNKRNTDPSIDDASTEIPKSVVFIPRRIPQHGSVVKRSEINHNIQEGRKNKGCSISATEDAQEIEEFSAMEEDELGASITMESNSAKPGRKYRTRSIASVDEA